MRRSHGEGSLDAEAESTLGVLGDLIAQHSQAAGHRATRLSIAPLELLIRMLFITIMTKMSDTAEAKYKI